MYVDTRVNHRTTKSTMVDFGTTHNFTSEVESRRLYPCWDESAEKMNVVNSVPLPITKVVELSYSWEIGMGQQIL